MIRFFRRYTCLGIPIIWVYPNRYTERIGVKADANTPLFFNSIMALSTQKPLSSMTTIPMWNIDLQSRSNREVVAPNFGSSVNSIDTSFG